MTASQEGNPVGISGQDWGKRPGSVMAAGCWERAGHGGSITGQQLCQHINHTASVNILDVVCAGFLVIGFVM